MTSFVDDLGREATVRDDAGRKFTLSIGIDEDGNEWPYVGVPREYRQIGMDEDGNEVEMFASCGHCDPPPHERVGPLPLDVAERAGALCGVVSPRTGKPCRNRAGSCSWHDRTRARQT